MNRSTIRARLNHSIVMSVFAQESPEWAAGKYSVSAVDRPWNDAGPLLRLPSPVKFSTHHRKDAILRHSHHSYELMYVYSGEIVHRFDGGAVKLMEGDLLLIAPGEHHSIDACAEECIAVNIICEADFMHGELMPLIAACAPVGELLNGTLSHLHMASRSDPSARSAAEMLISEFLDPDIASMGMIKCYLAALINALYRVYGANDGHVYLKDGGGRGDISYIFSYIQNHFATVTLGELARIFGYDSYYLSKVIRRSTGATFIELKHYFCIEEAKRLLRATDLTVREVSERVGFSNMSYFYRIFAAGCGCTPAEYRTKDDTDN